MILPRTDAQALSARILALSKAESAIVAIGGSEDRHLRFAQNMATTSGAPRSLEITVEAHFGKRSGSATGTETSDEALAVLVKKAEEVARLSPENPEFLPPLGPQKYGTATGFSTNTQKAGPEILAQKVAPVLEAAATKNLQASGYLSLSTGFSSFATSAGLFAYDLQTSVLHTVSARTPDGTGSGWAGSTHFDLEQCDIARLGQVAIEKAIASQKPQPLEPGDYQVILEPSAVNDLVGILIGDEFDARSADEGRSFATKEGGGTRLGETLFGKNITIFSDPFDATVPGSTYSTDGLPAERTMWIENGVLKNLQRGRFWAQKTKQPVVPSPTSLTIAGGSTTREEMIASVKRGLLITRFWYIREVDPQTVLLTGLTRDGVFLIEQGKITRPVQNFRFNESPVTLLRNALALGPTVRTYGEEASSFPISAPPMLIDKFRLTSISDAV